MSWTSRLAGVACSLVLVLSGCGAGTPLNTPDGGDAAVDAYVGPGAFEGTWTGTALATLTPISPPGTVQTNTTTMQFVFGPTTAGMVGYDLRVDVGGTSSSDRCWVGARRSGNTVTIPAGQPCTFNNPSPGQPAMTVLSGTATLSGSTLQVTLALEMSSTGTSTPSRARGDFSFTGTRS